ncbi:hypothetical protein BpHYR1_031583 [Brachionus plicatilis]|uniref:Uncharacterized protein n=1 Tax=Brachionus plicatilis TaxID=10195 RepID=A0A3M7SZU9_BRAPC|nr:hypothetical protein BpHYR1_031583 [Brachionus plicatilis]
MSECDAYKLIEEFIKKSSDVPNMKESNLELPPSLLCITSSDYSITNSSSSSFISSYLGLNKSSKEQTVLETPPETPEQIKTIQLPSKEDNLKPNRPYSYYVATNFHPLDLSILTTQTDAPLQETTAENGVKRRTNKQKRDESKRLSMSLSDIKTSQAIEPTKKTYSFFKLNSKKSKSNQHNLDKDFEETDDEAFAKSSQNSFKRMSVFNSTMPARFNPKNRSTNSPNQHPPGKLNKFFRNLFRINEKKSEDLDTSQTNFKFSRLFSFRHSHHEGKTFRYNSNGKQTDRSNSTSTNDTQCPLQLVVTDEQPSKIILPQISLKHEILSEQCSPEPRDLAEFNESYKLDNLEILKEKFYSEVAERLKKIASCTNSSANFSQEKSSLSSIDLIDIPYIDDEDEQSVDNLYSCSDFTISQASSKLLKTDMSDLVIEEHKLHDFIRNSTYSKFDELAVEYLNKYDSVWNKIAILFELINRSVQIVKNMEPKSELNQALIMKLKEIAANYIHDKYCDWIYKNGGWKSVPDIISLPRESNERCH